MLWELVSKLDEARFLLQQQLLLLQSLLHLQHLDHLQRRGYQARRTGGRESDLQKGITNGILRQVDPSTHCNARFVV